MARRRDEDSFYGPDHADADADAAIVDDHINGFHDDLPHGGCPRCPEVKD